MTKKICSVAGCERKSRALGMCSMHFQRMNKYGNPYHKTKLAKGEIKTCTIPHCNKPHKAKGYCSLHYQRFKRLGNPLELKTRKRGTGTIIPDGYLRITIDNGSRILEHRHIMEQHLGRKLKSTEIVHHIDGNRLNNSIDNLELIANQSIHAKNSKNSLEVLKKGRKLRWSPKQ